MPVYVPLPIGPLSWQPIDPGSTITGGTTYTSPTWSAGAYRFLRFWADGTSAGGTTITLALTGLSGTYDMMSLYTNGAGALTVDRPATWVVSWGGAGPYFEGELDIRTGVTRKLKGSGWIPTGPIRQNIIASHNDTTNPVTGLTLTTALSGNFSVVLLGAP